MNLSEPFAQVCANYLDINDTVSPSFLRCLDARKSNLYAPVISYIFILLLVGAPGNALVLYVYKKSFKKTSPYYFILTLALFDLVTCLLGMTTELYDLFHSYTFDNVVMCKTLRFIGNVTTVGSVLILLEVACDRYFKICKPLKMIPVRRIKHICIVTAVASVCLSIPTLVLYGIKQDIGYDCSVAEEFKDSLFAKIYFPALILPFVISFVLLIVLYIRIWVELKNRKKKGLKPDFLKANAGRIGRNNVVYLPSVTDDCKASVNVSRRSRASGGSWVSRSESISAKNLKIKASRNTIIFFVVTVTFVASFLPSVTIVNIRSLQFKTPTMDMLKKLFSKFYLLNSAINPIIYCFLNNKFRKELFKILRNLHWKRVNIRRVSKTSKSSVTSTEGQASTLDTVEDDVFIDEHVETKE